MMDGRGLREDSEEASSESKPTGSRWNFVWGVWIVGTLLFLGHALTGVPTWLASLPAVALEKPPWVETRGFTNRTPGSIPRILYAPPDECTQRVVLAVTVPPESVTKRQRYREFLRPFLPADQFRMVFPVGRTAGSRGVIQDVRLYDEALTHGDLLIGEFADLGEPRFTLPRDFWRKAQNLRSRAGLSDRGNDQVDFPNEEAIPIDLLPLAPGLSSADFAGIPQGIRLASPERAIDRRLRRDEKDHQDEVQPKMQQYVHGGDKLLTAVRYVVDSCPNTTFLVKVGDLSIVNPFALNAALLEMADHGFVEDVDLAVDLEADNLLIGSRHRRDEVDSDAGQGSEDDDAFNDPNPTISRSFFVLNRKLVTRLVTQRVRFPAVDTPDDGELLHGLLNKTAYSFLDVSDLYISTHEAFTGIKAETHVPLDCFNWWWGIGGMAEFLHYRFQHLFQRCVEQIREEQAV
eukprot:Protomagalhaensia_sp_Gyna_25__704@NODE_1330_length_1940_cov_344_634929_g1062_i0_p1_GENE_NODE_1330_length_1940_cov_344_634929_g1062_i0NODE_1330_length_1940_cov_344_634929_g1062_i0_p1_ORF_typecomplete_len474_score62_78Galactosyl_T/PF01762_21/0_26Galactosyl_T/PF01762_21/0_0002_NODE_1330_length_1940_cov_344_634929_g1062_i0411423